MVTVTAPGVITGNEARYSNGAIYNIGIVELPSDADIADNVAVAVSVCCSRYHLPDFPKGSFKWDASKGDVNTA